MPFGLHVVEDVLDLAIGADNEGGARDAHHLAAVQILLYQDAELVRDLLVRVGKQCEGQVVIILEFLLCSGGIARNADHDCARFLDLFVCVAEPARFFGSTRSVGFWIEKKNNGLAKKIFQGNLFAILIRRTEGRGFIIDLHGFSFSSPNIVISHAA